MKPMVVMAARAASMVGQDLLRFHRNRQNMDLQVSNKGIDGPVTQLDQHAERRLVEILKKSYPRHSFLGEDSQFTPPENVTVLVNTVHEYSRGLHAS